MVFAVIARTGNIGAKQLTVEKKLLDDFVGNWIYIASLWN
jgi:hypothetical protein